MFLVHDGHEIETDIRSETKGRQDKLYCGAESERGAHKDRKKENYRGDLYEGFRL
jgi:hypothetical protein